MHFMAPIYWRCVKRGSRTYASVPAIVKADVRTLAREEVEAGTLTEEKYAELIGESYQPDESTDEDKDGTGEA